MSTKPTNTASSPTISTKFPNDKNVVRITHPTKANPHVTTMIVPPKSHWGVPLHWHESHTEYVRIVQGYVMVTLGNQMRIVGTKDGSIEIKPFTLHGFTRADNPDYLHVSQGTTTMDHEGSDDGDWKAHDVVIEEWTTPADGRKEVFFRNMSGFINDFISPQITLLGRKNMTSVAAAGFLVLYMLQLMYSMTYMDNYPLMVGKTLGTGKSGKVSWFGSMVTHTFMNFCRILGKTLGWRNWWEEYTPSELRATCLSLDKQVGDTY